MVFCSCLSFPSSGAWDCLSDRLNDRLSDCPQGKEAVEAPSYATADSFLFWTIVVASPRNWWIEYRNGMSPAKTAPYLSNYNQDTVVEHWGNSKSKSRAQ